MARKGATRNLTHGELVLLVLLTASVGVAFVAACAALTMQCLDAYEHPQTRVSINRSTTFPDDSGNFSLVVFDTFRSFGDNDSGPFFDLPNLTFEWQVTGRKSIKANGSGSTVLHAVRSTSVRSRGHIVNKAWGASGRAHYLYFRVHAVPVPFRHVSGSLAFQDDAECRTDSEEWGACGKFIASLAFTMTNALTPCDEDKEYVATSPWPLGPYQYREPDARTDGLVPGGPFYVVPYSKTLPDIKRLNELLPELSEGRVDLFTANSLYAPFLEANFPTGAWISTPRACGPHLPYTSRLNIKGVRHCSEKCTGAEEVILSATADKVADSINPNGTAGVRLHVDYDITQVTEVVTFTWLNLVSQIFSYASTALFVVNFFFPTLISVPRFYTWGNVPAKYQSVLDPGDPEAGQPVQDDSSESE